MTLSEMYRIKEQPSGYKKLLLMRNLKKILSVSLLLFTGGFCFSPDAFAQLTVLSYAPAATETSSGSHYYVVNDPLDNDSIHLAWDFSKGLDSYFVQDISNITVKEKGSASEIKFDTSAGTTTPTPTGGLIITNADFIYTKEGSGSAPQIRRIDLKPTTVAFAVGKTYIVTMYNDLNGNMFQSNSGAVLDATYAFEFEVQPLPPGPSTTTSVAAAITASTTTTTAKATCIFVQALGEERKQELQAFRSLRDTRLLRSVRGFFSVLLYYFHAPEVSRIFNERPALMLSFGRLALAIAPQMERALKNGQNIEITEAQHREILGLMDEIARHASPLLQKTIAAIYGNLSEGVLPGKFGIIVVKDQ